MDKLKCEIKLSKSYNTFCFSAEGGPQEAEALRMYVMLKTFEFMDEFDQLKDAGKEQRIEAVKNKLKELGFGKWLDKDGWHEAK